MLRAGDGLHPLHCDKGEEVLPSLLLGQPIHCLQVSQDYYKGNHISLVFLLFPEE
jgi:hypothetical protein